MSQRLRSITPQKCQQGFALPTALMVGLVILLVVTSLLIRSNDDRVAASMQQQADTSLNVADGGVSRIQAFIAANPLLARFNLSDWLSNTVNLVNYAGSCGERTITQAQINNFISTSTNWQDVDPGDPSKGQFRLANYTYIPNDPAQPNSTPGRGILEIEGRLPSRQSIQKLRVTIPVQPGDVNGVPIPGVWLSQGSVGNNTMQANVLLNDCSISPSSVSVTGIDPTTGQPYRAMSTNLNMPALPVRPSFIPNSLPSRIRNNVTLPRSQDVPTIRTVRDQTFPVYEYAVDSLDIDQNNTLTVAPGARVTFYLNGSINRGGNIQHFCGNNPGVNCSPTDFQIFGYGPPGSSICLNGNNFIDTFVLAPNYTVGVAGSGGGQGGIRGAVWTNSWSNSRACGSGTSNTTVVQTANWDFVGVLPQNLPPKIAPPSTWERVDLSQ